MYHINAKQLYVFENYRGRGYFGDMDQDMILDYMELNPLSSEILDTVNMHFYTLDKEKTVFKPLNNKKGNKKVIWLVAIEQDQAADHDYRFAKKLKVIKPPKTTN